jgi:hypothetical protein
VSRDALDKLLQMARRLLDTYEPFGSLNTQTRLCVAPAKQIFDELGRAGQRPQQIDRDASHVIFPSLTRLQPSFLFPDSLLSTYSIPEQYSIRKQYSLGDANIVNDKAKELDFEPKEHTKPEV